MRKQIPTTVATPLPSASVQITWSAVGPKDTALDLEMARDLSPVLDLESGVLPAE